jgi:tetratricopeptide (TPR) repeat protein
MTVLRIPYPDPWVGKGRYASRVPGLPWGLIPFILILQTLVLFADDPEPSSSLKEAITARQERLTELQNKEDQHTQLRELATLYQLSGDIEKAQLSWQKGAFHSPGPGIDYASLLNSALLLFEMGRYEMAEVQAKVTLKGESDTPAAHQADLLLKKLQLLDSRAGEVEGEGAEKSLEGIEIDPSSPGALLWHYHLFTLAGMEGKAAKAKAALIENFPESPEKLILTGKAAEKEHFSDLLLSMQFEAGENLDGSVEDEADGAESSEVKYLQTGSFTDRENAEYLVRDLQELGFPAEIRATDLNGTNYHRVVVSIGEGESSQALLIELKESGFEATPLY